MSVVTLPDLDPLMSKVQVAAYLGFSKRWIEQQVRDGELPHYRPGGDNGPLRFRRSEVDEWLERRGR